MKARDRKPSIQQFMTAKIASIKKAFRIPMRVTIIVRDPAEPEAEIVFSDDDFDAVIQTMQRRRDAVLVSQGKLL